ncbi:Pantothenate kinase type III, CoaX-like [hydrothermal vent metagenome]|uniref:Type III pantothenate kinase n=1 Tax=hydrothermal vent metagenome TaxID=652676 RepID=A0A3B1C8U6_9ZZZZ
MGGAIVPGVRLSLNALYHHAAKLPEVEFAAPPSVIGRNTVNSMQSGAYYGYASLVDGIVNRMKEELGEPTPKVIATGGEARLVAHAASTIDEVEDRLTLEGLRVIHGRNRG